MKIKKWLKNIPLEVLDDAYTKLARSQEIKKFRDKRRVSIYSGTSLTKDQEQDIDRIYIENYGEKIPYVWHRHFTAFTGKFDPYYFPELLFIPEFENYMNRERGYVQAFEDKNILPVLQKAVGETVRKPEMM